MIKVKKEPEEVKCTIPCKYCLQEHCLKRTKKAIFEPYKYLEEVTQSVNDTIEFTKSEDYKFLIQVFNKYQKQEDIPEPIRGEVNAIYTNCGFGSTINSIKLMLLLKAFDYRPIFDHKN